MKIEKAIAELRECNESVPKPLRLPTSAEVHNAEIALGIRFHPDYVKYLLEASDVTCGTLEPCTVLGDGSPTDLVVVTSDAWNIMGVPKELLPICEDNSDYYCLTSNGQIRYWSHNGSTEEKWSSLADWIMDVWIGGG